MIVVLAENMTIEEKEYRKGDVISVSDTFDSKKIRKILKRTKKEKDKDKDKEKHGNIK